MLSVIVVFFFIRKSIYNWMVVVSILEQIRQGYIHKLSSIHRLWSQTSGWHFVACYNLGRHGSNSQPAKYSQDLDGKTHKSALPSENDSQFAKLKMAIEIVRFPMKKCDCS